MPSQEGSLRTRASYIVSESGGVCSMVSSSAFQLEKIPPRFLRTVAWEKQGPRTCGSSKYPLRRSPIGFGSHGLGIMLVHQEAEACISC